MQQKIEDLIQKRVLIIDGAMGTQLQAVDIESKFWQYENKDLEGCNELLNLTAPHILETIYENYALAGANFISTNTFGSMPWVLDEYEIGHLSYELSKLAASSAKKICEKYSTKEDPKFVLASIGPGTKLPSLGHITYDGGKEKSSLNQTTFSFYRHLFCLLQTKTPHLEIKIFLNGAFLTFVSIYGQIG